MFRTLRNRVAVAVIGVFALACGIAIAQTYPPPFAQTIAPNDVFQDVVGGNPQAPTYYATAAQIAGVPGYQNAGVATSGFSLTFGNSQTSIFMQPAATLATGTLTTAANPSDGQRECFLSTQTQTALTWNANTGQTMGTGAAPTAGVANTPICITYVKASQTWFRSP